MVKMSVKFMVKKYFSICTSLIFLIVISQKLANAQVIGNRANIGFGALTGSFSGEAMLEENGFAMPSLFNNFKNYYGLGINVSYQIKPHISIGAGFSQHMSGAWAYKEDQTFAGAGNSQSKILLAVRVHTAFSELGFFNKFRFFAELAPGFGRSALQLKVPTMDISSPGADTSPPMGERNLFFGVRLSSGVNINLHPRAGFFLAFSYHENWLNGLLFSDKRFGGGQAEGGLYFRFIQDKRFYYPTL